MAICHWCEQEMTTANSCTVGAFHLDCRPVEMIAFGAEPGSPTLRLRCGDCLDRRLFAVDEAWRRLAQPDMATRPGAELLRGVLPRSS